MAQKIQRNEPCPCGSGKKYKTCCMTIERDKSRARANNRDAIQHALGWLNSRHPAEINQWVEEVWLSESNVVERQGIGTADPKIRAIHDVNLLEMLVAEGEFKSEEASSSPLQLILGTEDLQLDANQRAYLEQLSQRPLRLYRVSECDPGTSFTLVDHPAIDGAEANVVKDKWASRMFEVGDIVGLRLLDSAGDWETSGAIYHIPDAFVEELVGKLADAGDNYSITLAHYWLKLVAAHV